MSREPIGEKPSGPIWIDMSDQLFHLSVANLIRVANLALNQLDMRQTGEIFHDIGYRPVMSFTDKDEAP